MNMNTSSCHRNNGKGNMQMRMNRVVQKTDLEKFKKEVLAKGPLAALPKNLPDRWLKAFGRDIALNDKAEAEGQRIPDEELPLGALLGVVMLLTHKKGGDPEQIEFTQDEIEQEYHSYKAAVYYEIIGRQTGVYIKSYDEGSVGAANASRYKS